MTREELNALIDDAFSGGPIDAEEYDAFKAGASLLAEPLLRAMEALEVVQEQLEVYNFAKSPERVYTASDRAYSALSEIEEMLGGK